MLCSRPCPCSLHCLPPGNERLGDFTPAFLWLLRDFYLKLEEEGGRKVRGSKGTALWVNTSKPEGPDLSVLLDGV